MGQPKLLIPIIYWPSFNISGAIHRFIQRLLGVLGTFHSWEKPEVVLWLIGSFALTQTNRSSWLPYHYAIIRFYFLNSLHLDANVSLYWENIYRSTTTPGWLICLLLDQRSSQLDLFDLQRRWETIQGLVNSGSQARVLDFDSPLEKNFTNLTCSIYQLSYFTPPGICFPEAFESNFKTPNILNVMSI